MIGRTELVGREDVINRIYDRINGQDSVSIVGYDGMGKSSLLRYIISNFKKDNLLMVEITDSEPSTALDFYKSLFDCVEIEIEENDRIDINLKYELKEEFSGCKDHESIAELKKTLNSVFYKLRSRGIDTILVIDDFDRMTKCINEGNREDAVENFKFLRNLANNNKRRVQYIVATKKSIEAISEECRVSGLPGIFNNPIKLELLEVTDVKKYILKRLSQYQYRINSHEDKLIFRVGGRVPGILKEAMDILIDNKNPEKNKGTVKEVNSDNEAEFIQEVEKRCDYIFRSYWKCMTYEEKRLLKHLCCNEDISDIEESLQQSARYSCQDMGLLNEDDTFVSEAFMNYVKRAEVKRDENGDTESEEDKEVGQRMKEAMDALKTSNDILKDSFQELWNAYDFAKKVMIEKLTADKRIKALEFADKEEYNRYISDYFKRQFEKYSMDTENCELLKGMSVQNIWDRIDEDIRKQIVQAELLSYVYRDTGFDQSPSCNPYCTAFEAIINRKALQPVMKAMQMLHPEYLLFELRKLGHNEGGLPATMMIGQFRSLVKDYYFYMMEQFKDECEKDPILKIYNKDFAKKLTDIHLTRNKCMHWEDMDSVRKTDEDKKEYISELHLKKKSLDVSDLDRLRSNLLGQESTGCIEYMLQLADSCEVFLNKAAK
ncbi:MAG TPA: ATP-binding protein [Clostridiales bacterium]|nr:ATP-binding protein [Clostridiales bacterium]